MLHLKQINLINFLSHDKTEIKFKQDQKILLSGKSGAGKTAIVEGLTWSLFGKARTDNKFLIKKGSKEAIVTVVLAEDKNVYKIERKINSKNKHELNVYEVKGKKDTPIKTTGVRDTQEYLEKNILRSSYLLFVNSILYPQENTDNFVKQTASKRKDIILEIIKATDYDEYLAEAKKKLQELKGKAGIAVASVEDKRKSIEEDKGQAEELKQLERNDKEWRKLSDKLYKEQLAVDVEAKQALATLNELEQEKIKKDAIKKQLVESGYEIDRLNKKAIELTKFNVPELEKKVKQLTEKRQLLKSKQDKRKTLWSWKDQVQKITSEAPLDTDYVTPINDLNRQLITVIKEKIDICPAVNQPCQILEDKKKQQVGYLTEQLERKQAQQKEYEKTKEIQRQKIEALGPEPGQEDEMEEIVIENEINELVPFENQLTEAKGAQTAMSEIEDGLKRLKDKKISDETRLAALEAASSAKGVNEATVKATHEEKTEHFKAIGFEKEELAIKINTNTESLAVAREAAKRIEKRKKEIEKLRKEIEVISEDKECLEAVKEAFGANGVKSIVIDYVLPELEEKVNNILEKLSNFRVELTTQKSGLGKETVLEGLFINIYNEVGEQFDFGNYSGGEKMRINYAIFEALASLTKINFRILDEAFFALDEETAINFVEIVNLLQRDVGTVVCITHLPEIKELFSEKITVQKINGTSQVI